MRHSEKEPRFLERLGFEVVKSGPRSPYFQVQLDSRHLNVNGVVHGSVFHALLDSVMGMKAFLAKDRQPVATAEVSVRYLRPVRTGLLRAHGRIIHEGKRLIVVEGIVDHHADPDDEGELAAIGQSTFMLL